jgi:hypothetical protein
VYLTAKSTKEAARKVAQALDGQGSFVNFKAEAVSVD